MILWVEPLIDPSLPPVCATGIANTMDLPERMLPRIGSRLGLHRISFGPYSHTQLQQILATRLEGIPAFDKQAVEFASRKVACCHIIHTR